MIKILHLTLHKQWFEEIAAGKKKHEFREDKPYWRTRLVGKRFDEIHFRNGYSKNAPFMRATWAGQRKTKNSSYPKGCFDIRIGEILEVKRANT